MNLIWRGIWTFIFSHFAPAVSLLDETSIYFRVLPTDIDILMHMNNGRYFSLLDLARLNFMVRNKHFSVFRKNKIYSVVASEMIRFRKSLDLFQRFEITTRIIAWDDKFVYVVHHFKVKGEIYALSLVKARFLRQAEGGMSPKEILSLLGHDKVSPALPDWALAWQQADQAFYDESLAIKK